MQDAERKLCREVWASHRGMKVPHIEPGSATRVPAGRSAAAIDSSSLRENEEIFAAASNTPGDKPVALRVSSFARPHRVVSLIRKGETHGSRKTRHKAPCAA